MDLRRVEKKVSPRLGGSQQLEEELTEPYAAGAVIMQSTDQTEASLDSLDFQGEWANSFVLYRTALSVLCGMREPVTLNYEANLRSAHILVSPPLRHGPVSIILDSGKKYIPHADAPHVDPNKNE